MHTEKSSSRVANVEDGRPARPSFGPYLRSLREAAGLTLRQVQECRGLGGCGVTNGYLSHLETGKVKAPNPNLLHQLADCYAADYLELITLTEDGKAILDRHPDIDGLFVFSGDNGSSFKTAPAVGRVLAEWLAEGTPRLLDPAPFRMTRFAEGQPLFGEHEYGDRDNDYTRAQRLMPG